MLGEGDFDDRSDDKLCSLNSPIDRESMRELKVLVKEPDYICSTCGRASSKAENLCAPELL
jgi:hypothetical protein